VIEEGLLAAVIETDRYPTLGALLLGPVYAVPPTAAPLGPTSFSLFDRFRGRRGQDPEGEEGGVYDLF
jgi:hypothetical protein